MSRLTLEKLLLYCTALCEDEGDFKYVLFNSIGEYLKELQHYKDLAEQGRLIVGHKDPVGEQGPEGKGQWIDNHCSVCGMTPLGEEIWKHLDSDPPKFEYYMNYCPNCGAKMVVLPKLAELKGTEE